MERAESTGAGLMTKRAWDTEDYFSIAAASFRDGLLRLTFADGSTVEISPATVLPKNVEGPCWSDMRINDFRWLVIPIAQGEVELAGDVVRINTDNAYHAH